MAAAQSVVMIKKCIIPGRYVQPVLVSKTGLSTQSARKRKKQRIKCGRYYQGNGDEQLQKMQRL